jgi:hypothetical protein
MEIWIFCGRRKTAGRKPVTTLCFSLKKDLRLIIECEAIERGDRLL